MGISPRALVRAGIWAKSCALAAALILTIWGVDSNIMSPRAGPRSLSFGLSCILVTGSAAIVVASLSAIRKTATQLRLARYERLSPPIQERLASHVSGRDETPTLAFLRRKHRRVVDRCTLDFLSSLAGARRDRIIRLAMDLGIVERLLRVSRSRDAGRRRRAVSGLRLLGAPELNERLRELLTDQDESIRIEAARALLKTAEPDGIEAAFRFAVEGTPLARAVLALDLKRHATFLCAEIIPRTLQSSRPEYILAALELLRGWSVALPINSIVPLTNHPSSTVRVAALGALPAQMGAEQHASEWTARLADPDPESQSAAARAIKMLHVASALPQLRRLLLESSDREVLYAVASAIAALGPEGESLLLRVALESPLVAAQAALAALGRLRISSMVDKGAM